MYGVVPNVTAPLTLPASRLCIVATSSPARNERNHAADEPAGEDTVKEAEGDETDGAGAIMDVTERKPRGGRGRRAGVNVSDGGQRQGKLDHILRALMQIVAVTAKEHTISRTSLEKKAGLFFSGQLRAVQNICKKPDERCLAFFACLVLMSAHQDEQLNFVLSLAAETQRQLRRVGEEAAQREKKLLAVCEESRDTILAMGEQMRDLDERLKQKDMKDSEREGRHAEPFKIEEDEESERLAIMRANILGRLRKD